MEAKFCQSCGMPLQKNEEYCCYCYKDGAFTMNCTISFRKKRLSVLRPAGLVSSECGVSSRRSPFLFEWNFS